MTDMLLSWIPLYGAWFIMICVFLSCLAIPVPSSLLVMFAGGLAAIGGYSLWQLIVMAWMGFVLGDQTAFFMARKAGMKMIRKWQSNPKPARAIEKARKMIDEYGLLAVFLTRTIFSPLGAYVSYLSGGLESQS